MLHTDGVINELDHQSSSTLECEVQGPLSTDDVSPDDKREVEKNDDVHIKLSNQKRNTCGHANGVDAIVSTSDKDEKHSSVELDDRDRLFAAEFEDQSIDHVIKGDLTAAFELLLEGLSVLEKKNNLLWSARYLSGVHLNLYQVLLQLIQDEEGNDNDNNNSKNKYSGGKRNRNSKPKRYRDKLSIWYYSELMEKHLRSAHSLNLMLQGPLCPETLNTQNLIEQHGL